MLKRIHGIRLTEESEIHGDRIGYCGEVGRYVLKQQRAFPVIYYTFCFLTREQFEIFKARKEELDKDRIAYTVLKHEMVKTGSPAGAEYIRDYRCSPEFRSAGGSPLPARWDGPYLYDGEHFLWEFVTGGKHYGVPALDFNRKHGGRYSDTEEPAGRMYCFDGNEKYRFFGREIEEGDIEETPDPAKEAHTAENI